MIRRPEESISSIYNADYEQKIHPETEVISDNMESLKHVVDAINDLRDEGIFISGTVERFFNRSAGEGEGNFLIHDKDDNKQYLIGFERLQQGDALVIHEDTILIDDLRTFILFLQETQASLEDMQHGAHRESDRWARGQNLYTIWNNATSVDFRNPVLFLGRVINELRDETLVHVSSWEKVAGIDVNGIPENVFIKRVSSNPSQEAPHELNIAITDRESPAYQDNLPAIRFGVVEHGTAIIYAVQMPEIEKDTANTIHSKLSRMLTRTKEMSKYLTDLHQTNVNLYAAILGDTPLEELVADTDEGWFDIGKKIHQTLKERAGAEGYEKYIFWVQSQYRKFNIPEHMIPIARYDDLMIMDSYQNYQNTLKLFDQRRERLSRLTGVMGIGKTEEFRGAPPSAVISMVAGISVLRLCGIKEILIPLSLQYRQHLDETMDKRVQSQMFQTVGRIINEVDGVSLTSDPEEDGYYHLKIEEMLHSKNPLLQGIMDGIKGLDLER